MNGFKWGIIAAVTLGQWMSGTQTASAQYYSGYWSGGGVYGHPHHSGFYSGGYIPGYSHGAYYGSPYSGYGSYSGSYYGIGSLGYGSSYGLSSYGGYYGYRRPPVVIAPVPVLGTTTTIIRGGPTGGVVEYTHNGNGYIYTPDSSYPAVVTQSPTIGPARTYVVDGPKPVVVESRPSGPLRSNPPPLSKFPSMDSKSITNIKLICPKTAPGPLSYTLNGHPYTIKPGYSQTFPDDRPWTIEFKRGGDDSEAASYALKAGIYTFVAGPAGWDLQQPTTAAPTELPPPPTPLPPAPEPAL